VPSEQGQKNGPPRRVENGSNPPGVTFKPLRSCLSTSKLSGSTEADDGDSTLSSRTPPAGTANNGNVIKRNVSFGRILIREHPRALGDNPSVSSGPALSLGWYSEDPGCEHSRTTELPLDEYEGQRPSRRSRDELVVPRSEREKCLLHEAGVSLTAMYAAQREAAKIKHSRRRGIKEQKAPAVKLLASIGKLFEKQGKRNSAEQRQLDELMERAAAAEKVRKRHEEAYKEGLQPMRRDLPHSASEPFFLAHVPETISVTSPAGNSFESNVDDEPLEF